MLLFDLIPLVLTSFLAITARAESCRVVNDSLTTPDGKTIYLDFGQHGSVEDRARLETIATTPIPPRDRDGIQYLVDDYVERRSSLIEDHERRSRRIEELVRQGKISFIGVELDPQSLSSVGGTSGLLRSHRDAKSALSRRGVSNRDSSRFLTSGSIGAGSYAWLSNETVRSRTRYVPLEDDGAKNSGLDQLRAEDRLYDELPELVASGAISQNVASSLQARANAAMRERRPISTSDVHTLTTMISNPAGSAWARSLLNGTNSSIATFDRRENQVVANALSQHENGLISFGSLHRDGIIEKLESECRRMGASSGRTRPSRTTTRSSGSTTRGHTNK